MATVAIAITIEPSWTSSHYSEVIEVDEDDLNGLTGEARAARIIDLASDVVNQACPWSAEEVTG